MINEAELLEFVRPYYENKEIMHNMWHIELVRKKVEQILAVGNYNVDEDCLILATYFHGFIYSDEDIIRQWLISQNYNNELIDKTIRIA